MLFTSFIVANDQMCKFILFSFGIFYLKTYLNYPKTY